MRYRRLLTLVVIVSPFVLSGCVSAFERAQYEQNDAGFLNVSAETARATGKQTVWVQSQEDARKTSERVHGLVHRKTIDADTAVQVALLNNKGLQAAYSEIGISAAEAWQQTLLENPTVSIGTFGIAAPELGAFRTIEGMIASNILAMTTRRKRVLIADTRFRQAQLKAVVETLSLAAETRTAWINAVAAFEQVFYFNQAQKAADAASELAKRLGESGALGKGGQAREHAFYSELSGEKARARLASKIAKEELTRQMGLWGEDIDYFVPDQLPQLPNRVTKRNAVEKEALQRRIDLRVAKLELEAIAASYKLTDATRYLTDFEVIGGFEAEREVEDGDRKTVTTPQIEIGFVIPIFDSGKPRMRKAELAYMQAANKLAEKAVNIRSEARSAYLSYRSSYDIAQHYRRNVLPLRTTIEEESLLTYNGMITSTFELLADTRAKINSIILSVNAKKEFWLADANLAAALHGAAGGNGEVTTVAGPGGGGH